MKKNNRLSSAGPQFPQFTGRSPGFIVSGFAVATVVSTTLFWVMFQLLSTVQDGAPPPEPTYILDFVDLNRTLEEPKKREPKPEMPPLAKLPLPAAATDWSSSEGVPSFQFAVPESGDLFGQKGHGKIGIGEREYMPLTEIQPNYPERALLRGIEGTCVVIYTITKAGSVSDVRVDESRCSSSLFHASSLKAASKFKYAPRIVDGETREARNVTKLFRYSISD